MMTADDLAAFMTGQSLHAFDPATRAHVATVEYRADGTCRLTFADGATEGGTWGIAGDSYWTRYDRFRGGQRNGFRLEPLAPGTAQAWHLDGSRAFVQTRHTRLPDPE